MQRGLLPLLMLLLVGPLHAEPSLRIAVAANFKATLEAINAQFTEQTGTHITLSSASTGVLASQVYHGAPFDIFFAADESSPRQIATTTQAGSVFCYARGRLALAGGTLAELQDATRSLAIANPATAPYGRAALEALTHQNSAAGPQRLVRGASVAQVYQFWHSGAVDMALLPLALAPDGAALVPAQWHTPIDQYLLVINHTAAVERYLKWIRSDRVRSLIREAGYESCP